MYNKKRVNSWKINWENDESQNVFRQQKGKIFSYSHSKHAQSTFLSWSSRLCFSLFRIDWHLIDYISLLASTARCYVNYVYCSRSNWNGFLRNIVKKNIFNCAEEQTGFVSQTICNNNNNNKIKERKSKRKCKTFKWTLKCEKRIKKKKKWKKLRHKFNVSR